MSALPCKSAAAGWRRSNESDRRGQGWWGVRLFRRNFITVASGTGKDTHSRFSESKSLRPSGQGKLFSRRAWPNRHWTASASIGLNSGALAPLLVGPIPPNPTISRKNRTNPTSALGWPFLVASCEAAFDARERKVSIFLFVWWCPPLGIFFFFATDC